MEGYPHVWYFFKSQMWMEEILHHQFWMVETFRIIHLSTGAGFRWPIHCMKSWCRGESGPRWAKWAEVSHQLDTVMHFAVGAWKVRALQLARLGYHTWLISKVIDETPQGTRSVYIDGNIIRLASCWNTFLSYVRNPQKDRKVFSKC